MRVLVCGGRDFTDDDWFFEVMNEINDTYNFHNKITKIIHGGARGADSLADMFAKANNISVDVFEADWYKYGRSAGPLRNQRMLDEGKPDLVVAFPGGKGTAHMVKIAKEANITVKEI